MGWRRCTERSGKRGAMNRGNCCRLGGRAHGLGVLLGRTVTGRRGGWSGVLAPGRAAAGREWYRLGGGDLD